MSHEGDGVRATAVVAALGYVAALLLLWWTRRPQPVYLIGAALATGAALVAWLWQRPPASSRRWLAWSAAALWLAVGASVLGTRRFEAIENDWAGLTAERRAELGGRLSRQMAAIVAQGRRAAELAAEAAAAPDTAPFEALERIRRSSGVDALAVLSPVGDLWAWAGQHRGALPVSVRAGGLPAYFEERPLFSYVYFMREVEAEDRHAVAAVLVETGLLGEETGVEATFADRSKVPASFRVGGGDDAVWSLVEGGDTVVSARIEPVVQAELRQNAERAAGRVIVAAVLLALLLVSGGWLRAIEPRPAPWLRSVPLLAFAIALPVAPLGAVLGIDALFSPLLFALPLPSDPSLGEVLALLVPVAALAAASRSPLVTSSSPARAALPGALAVAIAFPAGIRLLIRASAPDVLDSVGWLWFGLQPAATLLLGIIALLGMPRARRKAAPLSRRTRALLVAGGLGLATTMSAVLTVRLDPLGSLPPLASVPWALAFFMVAVGLAWAGGRRGGVVRWSAAVWLAATAVLPQLWVVNMSARLRGAERELSTLGTQAPPIIDYLLLEFGREVRARAATGESGVQLLHRSWVASGLAREPWAARITLWRNGERAIELDLGEGEPTPLELDVLRDAVAAASVDTARISAVINLPTVTKLVTAPLGDGGVVTVTVPPRRTLAREGVIGTFLGEPDAPDARLTLIEATQRTPAGGVRWDPTGTGWRSEMLVPFPEGDYHAHLEVIVTPLPVRFARGVLLLAFDLGLAVIIWAIGCIGRGRAPVPAGVWAELKGSFRARVTVTLFTFFLIPTALFGWVAYRAVAGEVERAARIIASRAVAQAVVEFPESGGDLRSLAQRIGAEVLLFHRGELADASSPEGMELGVYGAWMPPGAHRRLASPEEIATIERQSIAGQSFLVAYRALPPAPVSLGVPSSLTAGDTADRQRELAHMILFATLMGALLSLALSVAVGRALAGPIGRLRRAATAVGAGRLNKRLPQTTGEFGQVFDAFNRMTQRLRRARAREVRTARVLAWGEMARQIAHEIKNPLTPVKLSVQHIQRAWRDGRPDFDEILEQNVQQILREIDRLSEIARAFSRYGAPAETAGPLVPVHVAPVVREALTLYRAGDPEIRYVDAIDPDVPPVHARPAELKEVLLNLVENARAALDGGGTITVRAEHIEDRVEIEVRDNGPGIPPEFLARIFEPHFSTRSAGTGLGLAIVRRLVEGWGATVTAASEAGAGTSIVLQLRPAGGAEPQRIR